MSPLESQVASLSLGGHVGWQFRIDLALSEPSTCSSPASEVFDFNYMPDSADPTDNDEEAVPLLSSVLMEQMVTALSSSGESPILEYLFWNPVTLTDVEVLVPALINSAAIMDQLVVNIGYFNALGLIQSCDLEHILIHLLAAGDGQNYLYETTKAYIELECRRHQHVKYIDCQMWAKPPGKTNNLIKNVEHREAIGNPSHSQLHTGSGLTDRKHPRVRLPQDDTRLVGAMLNPLASEMNRSLEYGCLWGQRKAILDSLSGRKQKREIVVKLPPTEPAPVVQVSTRTFAIQGRANSSLCP